MDELHDKLNELRKQLRVRCAWIPDYPCYAVTARGEVYSCKPIGATTRLSAWHPIHVYVDADGYATAQFHIPRGRRRVHVHRLVMLAFNGPANGRLVRHRDGDGTNPALSNLRWGTHRENAIDAIHHRTSSGIKLTAQQVKWARTARRNGTTRTQIAGMLGITARHLSNIFAGKHWGHT